MKRMISLLLLLAFALLSLVACGETPVTFTGPLTAVLQSEARLYGQTVQTEMLLGAETQAWLLERLSTGTWVRGESKCKYDYTLRSPAGELAYSSDCGALYHVEGDRTLTLSEEEREALNAHLRVGMPTTKASYPNEPGDRVTLFYYPSFSGSMQSKDVTGALATELITQLSALTETGEVAAAVGDSTCVLPTEDTYTPYTVRSTLWILAGDTLYRVDDNLSRVERYMGEGHILGNSEECSKLARRLWAHYPYDSYSGTYDLTTGELTVDHVFTGASSVRFEVEELTICGEQQQLNELVLTVYSDVAQTAFMVYEFSNGGCVIADLGYGDIPLNGVEPTTVRITFPEDPLFGTGLDVSIGATKLHIYVKRK